MRTLFGFIATLAFLIYFAWQPLGARVAAYKHDLIDNISYTAIQEAKNNGEFTQEDLQNIQEAVANDVGYSTDDVSVSGTTTFTPWGQTMYLTITIPTHISLINLFGNDVENISVTQQADSGALVNSGDLES